MPELDALMPLLVLLGIVMSIWAVLSWIAQRNARTRKRRLDQEDGDSPG
jgi:hypothetical protein